MQYFIIIGAVLVAACAAQSNNAFWGNVQYDSTMSFSDQIEKSSKVMSVIEEKITYPPRGVLNYRPIVAVRAYDQKTNGNGAKATIIAGGINNTTVTVLFKSQRGHGINFRLEVFTPACH